jgi:hypothetical protein
MKITRKQLKRLIETFIVGPEGRAINMGQHSLKRSSHNLESLLDPYSEKIINHPRVIKSGFKEKFKTLLNTGNIKDKLSAFMLAKSLSIISNDEHNEIKKIVSDMKRLESAEDLKKNPPKDMAIGYPGKKVYHTEEGDMTDKKYSVYHAQRDDPNFEQTLSQRIREMIPDLERFAKGIYDSYLDPTVYDHELIEEIVKTVSEMVKQKYGKIYSSGFILPTVEKILYELGVKELVFNMSGKREEYAEYLDRTDLGMKIDSILEDVYDDVTVDSIIQKLKNAGYDEIFFKEAFEDPQGNLLFPQFNIEDYNEIMIYYLIDRINSSVDDIGFDGEVIYRGK